MNASGSGTGSLFGDILVASLEGHDSEVSEEVDWSVEAVSGNDDDTSPVTCGSLSPDMGEESKNWFVEDPDQESDVSAEDRRMSERHLCSR